MDEKKQNEEMENWKRNQTKIPATINKIHHQMNEVTADIITWLFKIGVEIPGPYTLYLRDGREALVDRLNTNTAFNIKILHENDYIECGGAYNDSEGKMFHIITPITISIKFSPEKLEEVTEKIELFSERKLPINKQLPTISLSFFSWERDIKIDSLDHSPKYGMKLIYDLKFEIRHSFP